MRMWQINPAFLCRQHLLGEHSEIHKFLPSFVANKSIAGRIAPTVQIEPLEMLARHDRLVAEMLRRGYNHRSPYFMPDLSNYPIDQLTVRADLELNLADLADRCPDCRERMKELSGQGLEIFDYM